MSNLLTNLRNGLVLGLLLVAPALASDHDVKPTDTTVDTISAGTTFSHHGTVVVKGGIGEGAIVNITEGGLRVKGDVADGAAIVVKDKKQEPFTVGTFLANLTKGPSGLTIDGNTGDGVSLRSNSFLDIKNAGEDLTAVSGNAFDAENLGANAKVDSGNAIHFKSAGEDAALNAGNSIQGQSIGLGSAIGAGNSINIDEIAANSTLNAGNSIVANEIGACVKAGASNSIKAKQAHQNADLDERARLEINAYFGSADAACPQ